MDQFVTVYRKDYLWPYIRSFGKKLVEPELKNTGYEDRCKCRPTECIHTDPKQPDLTNLGNENQDWNRTGPMGRLLEPKLYPVKLESSPDNNTTKADQPNQFMSKLQEKYPYLYEVLKEAPSDEYQHMVNKDRFQTTYQIDFCKAGFIPPNLVRVGGDIGVPPCPERLSKDHYESFQKIKARRPAAITKLGMFKRKKSTCGGGGGGGAPDSIHPWTFDNTEYQDEICKLGEMILKCNKRAKKRSRF